MASGPDKPKTLFAEELNQLIRRYLDDGADPQDVVNELTREVVEHPMQPAR